MYMAPITAARAPASTAARRLTGLIVLPVSAAVMVPFLAGYAVYAAVALGVRALFDMVDYAGQVVLGR